MQHAHSKENSKYLFKTNELLIQSPVKKPLQDSSRYNLNGFWAFCTYGALEYFVYIFHSKTKVGVYFSNHSTSVMMHVYVVHTAQFN